MIYKLHTWHMPSRGEKPDANERFVRRKCALYLSRVLERYHCLNEPALTLAAWLLGDGLYHLAEGVLGRLKGIERRSTHELLFNGESPPTLDELPAFLLKAVLGRPKPLLAYLERSLLTQLHRLATNRAKPGRCDLEAHFNRSASMFGLSTAELELSLFFYLLIAWQPVEDFFDDHLGCARVSGRKYLLAALGLSQKELDLALRGRLQTLGFFEEVSPSIIVDRDLLPLFSEPLSSGVKGKLFKRVRGPALSLSNYLIDQPTIDHVLKLLANKPETATNVLLYGAVGTGKSSFSYSLVKKLGVPAYEIVRGSDLSAKTQRGAITSCLNLTDSQQGSIIIVDEADNLLNTMGRSFFDLESQDKSWLNQTLETPGARMIWITNQVDGMEESVRRRFAFSRCFKPFGRAQREQVWRSVLKRRGVRRMLSPGDIRSLAKEYQVSAGAVDLAVAKARETEGGQLPPDRFLHAVKSALNAHVVLLNDGIASRDRDQIEEAYSLEGLNLDCDLHGLLNRLQRVDEFLRHGDRDQAACMSMLLYGPPGTGKSLLAVYLAQRLEREVIVKRPSDLLSKWVGESEQLLAQAFASAENEDAVLVIDEVDSFLYSRDRATHTWETSLVNELLTQMDSFRGILICTTNRLADLDLASLRRFSVKVLFDFLNPDGNEIFYQRLLAPLVSSPLGDEQRVVLRSLARQTPGDFRVVRDVFRWGDAVSHGALLEALKHEADTKNSLACGKIIGFGCGS